MSTREEFKPLILCSDPKTCPVRPSDHDSGILSHDSEGSAESSATIMLLNLGKESHKAVIIKRTVTDWVPSYVYPREKNS